jgi:hypothetical protein
MLKTLRPLGAEAEIVLLKESRNTIILAGARATGARASYKEHWRDPQRKKKRPGAYWVTGNFRCDPVRRVRRVLLIAWLIWGSLGGPRPDAHAEAPPASGAMPGAVLVAGAAPAPGAFEPFGRAPWIDWNGPNFFEPCRGDCALSLYGGKEVTSSMERIFLVKHPPTPAWDWRWRSTYLAAGAFSRRLVGFSNLISIEPELGVGQRFGQMHATELWAALNFRWVWFPWNRYVKTSIGLSDGISFTTKLDQKERLISGYRIEGNRLVLTGSQWLNFFTPELTLALPQYPDHELLFRFHHRSGIYGRINDTFSGAQFFSVGYRARF